MTALSFIGCAEYLVGGWLFSQKEGVLRLNIHKIFPKLYAQTTDISPMQPMGWERVQNRISDIIQKMGGPPAARRLGQRQVFPQVSTLQKTGPIVPKSPYTKFGTSETSKPPASTRNSFFARQLNALIESEAHKQQVAPQLVRAMVQVESGGRPQARSNKGALGLMQLMPATARKLGIDPLKPRQNLAGGIRYLKEMAYRFGDLDLALAAYNAGPGAVKKYGGVPPYKETRQYVQKIRDRL